MSLERLLGDLELDRGPLEPLRRRAAARPRRILLPEAQDERVLLAAAALLASGLARPLLLGIRPLRGLAADVAAELGPACWWDPAEPVRRLEAAELLLRRRRHRGMTQGQAHVAAAEPLLHALAMLSLDRVDAVVAGAAVATADVARATLQVVGPAPGIRTVSGAMLMLPPAGQGRPVVLADCAVVPQPSPDQLVDIAECAVAAYRELLGHQPAVALLSFSTAGSSPHPAAAAVAEAAGKLRRRHREWPLAGEVQVDAALVPEVARTKGIDWGEHGRADLLVFPDLGAGNIGYKLLERLGGWRAVGPLMLGLRRSVCDLSRGCSALDVVDAAVVASLRAGAGGAG
jgi:phosphate acetyltransferase